MAVDEFDKSRAVTDVDDGGERHRLHALVTESNRRTAPRETAATRQGITWVRASDLLNSGTGRIAGRGIDLQAELARRLRRAPATTTRAFRDRARRLPSPYEFGRVQSYPQISRHALERS